MADFVFLLGAVLMAAAIDISMLLIGRFVVGLGVGLAAMVAPIYLAEVSPPKYRGMIVATNVLFITTG